MLLEGAFKKYKLLENNTLINTLCSTSSDAQFDSHCERVKINNIVKSKITRFSSKRIL